MQTELLGKLLTFEFNLGGSYVIAKRIPVRTIGGVSGKFRRMCEVYKIFVKDWEHMLDFSDQSIVELFNHESLGLPIQPLNGYSEGKKWLSVQVTMWKEDIEKRLLFLDELYSDSKFPHWWLDSVFKRRL